MAALVIALIVGWLSLVDAQPYLYDDIKNLTPEQVALRRAHNAMNGRHYRDAQAILLPWVDKGSEGQAISDAPYPPYAPSHPRVRIICWFGEVLSGVQESIGGIGGIGALISSTGLIA